MKPNFESIAGDREQSFACRAFRPASFPFNWHFHPEVELTYIGAGYGQRFVGDHIDTFAVGDLVLIGGDVPHSWMSSPDLPRKRGACGSIVIQFRADFLGRDFFGKLPEMKRIAGLLRRARRGLFFEGDTRDQVSAAMARMESASAFGRLTILLECLELLANDPAARPLASEGFRPETPNIGRSGISEVLAYLNHNYREPVRLATAAEMTHLSAGAFSRFFHRSTGKSFTDYLTSLRIGRACELMIATDRKISSIAFDAGFSNLSNFNRLFLKVKGCTPRAFRDAHWAH